MRKLKNVRIYHFAWQRLVNKENFGMQVHSKLWWYGRFGEMKIQFTNVNCLIDKKFRGNRKELINIVVFSCIESVESICAYSD